MKHLGKIGPAVAAVALVGAAALAGPFGNDPAARAQAPPTPYHEGQPSPVASPHAMQPTVLPLPAPADQPTANMMADGGAAMVAAADAMAAAAGEMAGSGEQALVDLGGHWTQDAAALRERGAWMVITATSAGMVHDPARAHEVDVWNLKAGGVTMTAEGEAMAAHGQEMQAQTAQLREGGALAPDLADELIAAGQAMVEAGEALQRDGERMERYADSLIQSLGLQP